MKLNISRFHRFHSAGHVFSAVLLVLLLAGCAHSYSHGGSPVLRPMEMEIATRQSVDVVTPERQSSQAKVPGTTDEASATRLTLDNNGRSDAIDYRETATNNTNTDLPRLRRIPYPPPSPKWRPIAMPSRIVAIDGVEYSVSDPMRAEANGFAIEVLATSIMRETVRFFISIERSKPEQDHALSEHGKTRIVPVEARLVGEDDRSVHNSQHIEFIAEFNGVSLALISLPLTGNRSSTLSLDVPVLLVEAVSEAQERVFGSWHIPVLTDTSPGEAEGQAGFQVFTESTPHHHKNGVEICFGDKEGTASGMSVLIPNQVDAIANGVDEAWVFTLTSVDGRDTALYLLVMSDGSVRQVTKEEYEAVLKATIYAPNPTPVIAPEPGPDPQEFPTPLPYYTPDVSRPIEEMIKEHSKDLTPTP